MLPLYGQRNRPLLSMLGAAVLMAAHQPALAQEVFEGLSSAQLFALADARRQAGADQDAASLYAALTEDDDADIRAEARYRHGLMLADAGDYAGAAVLFRALLDEKPDAAVAVDWTRALSPRSQLVGNLSISEARYEANPFQNGQLYDLGLNYERALSARTGVSVGASATRNDARDAGYATWSGGLNLGAWRETPMGTVFGSTSIRRTEGDERLFLFPERRKEWLTSARVGITMRKLTVYGFAPTARVSVERNSSTVGLYDYRRVAADFGISRAF